MEFETRTGKIIIDDSSALTVPASLASKLAVCIMGHSTGLI